MIQVYNRSTKLIVVIMGILTGLLAIPHGISEIFQGNKSTSDILERVGAFTIMPNYLLTGILTVIISISIILWTIFFIDKKYGPSAYLVLSVLLFLFGGGVAFSLLAILTVFTGTRIIRPLTRWEKVLSVNILEKFSRIWLPLMIFSFFTLSIGISIWLFILPPGEIRQVGPLHYICWSSLIIGFLLLVLTIILGFARDLNFLKTNNKI